ncbi:MAG: hypothetical protein ACTSQS_10685 [Promethearchaeota archaeon]
MCIHIYSRAFYDISWKKRGKPEPYRIDNYYNRSHCFYNCRNACYVNNKWCTNILNPLDEFRKKKLVAG